ncbi:MAG: DUF1802 family protein [Stenomitos rutilans HA7619-LM2]|nr:DUF1802 family protein [Stenomitos rutilans HA7619-LM2]
MTHALKEWQVAVHALEQGETILLLRKGGIRDARGTFTVAHERFWLYPTHEHQRSHLVKEQYADAITPVEPGWHPETVRIASWAQIIDRFEVSDAAVVAALHPFHIWHETFVVERLKWKPSQPLSILLLRVYTLPQPQMLSYEAAYGGCKSWLDLTPMSAQHASLMEGSENLPVLGDADYAAQREAIQAIIAPW